MRPSCPAGVFILIFHVVLNERAKQEIFKTGRKNVGRVRAFVAGQPYHSSSPGGSKVLYGMGHHRIFNAEHSTKKDIGI